MNTCISLFLASGIGTFFREQGSTIYKIFIEKKWYTTFLEGLKNTILITLGALLIGVVIGTLIAFIKYLAEDIRFLKPLAKFCDIYITVIRGIPITVLLMIFFLVIFPRSGGTPMAILVFGINSGAYMAELIRSGINAVDAGQMEAGLSLGMSRTQSMRVIIFPQAIRYILPAIGNEMIALLKETSVAGYVSVIDITRAADLAKNNTFNMFYPLLVVALVYLTFVILLTSLLRKLERRLAKGVKR